MKNFIVCFCIWLPLVMCQKCDDVCSNNNDLDPECLIKGSCQWNVFKSQQTGFLIPSIPAFLLQLKLQGNFTAATTTMNLDVFQFQPNATGTCRERFTVSIIQNTSSCKDASCNTGTSNYEYQLWPSIKTARYFPQRGKNGEVTPVSLENSSCSSVKYQLCFWFCIVRYRDQSL